MSDRRKHLEFLLKTARDAGWAGHYERALDLQEEGLALSRNWKDRDFEDTFTCNRATTLLEMDRQDIDLSRLKEIVIRNPTKRNGVLAAYICANVHEARKDYGRAIFYAQSALQRSRENGLDELLAASLNTLGNLELHESRFESALGRFREALETLQARGEEHTHLGALYSDNLGYCFIALDQVETGLPYVERAISIFESLGARQALDYPYLDHCLADLKSERPLEAEPWGVRALAIGKEFAREDVIKNSHYLLAETYAELGRESDADLQYEALGSYYPDFPELKHYLQQISLLEVINLRA
jgi:tetratricopeptide (TPR) repeat protein